MYEKKLEAAARLLEVMDTLREKCPWDREQTFHSLRNNTIEECFELVDAITDDNFDGIREELGDVLLHIVFYSKMGEEQGKFDFEGAREAYFASLHRLSKAHVDVLIGNHTWNNDTWNKARILAETGENTFVDPTLWNQFLDYYEKKLNRIIREEAAAAEQ